MTPANRLMLAIWAVCLLAIPAVADSITFDVALNTSAVQSGSGAIYMQFSPGLNADLASVAVSGFSIDSVGSLVNPPITNGDVVGSLDAPPLVIANTFGLNDYLHFLNFGDSILFRVQFTLPPLLGDSGSAFAFGLTGPDGFSPILTPDEQGFMGIISYDQVGAFSAQVLSESATITSAVPEPSPLALLGTAVGFLMVMLRRRG